MTWAGHVARMGDRRGEHRVCWRNVRERDNLENLDLEGKMRFQEEGLRGMDRITVVQDRNRWRALVNAVMNIRVP